MQEFSAREIKAVRESVISQLRTFLLTRFLKKIFLFLSHQTPVTNLFRGPSFKKHLLCVQLKAGRCAYSMKFLFYFIKKFFCDLRINRNAMRTNHVGYILFRIIHS